MNPSQTAAVDTKELYLDLMKRCLLNTLYGGDQNMHPTAAHYSLDTETGKYHFLHGNDVTIKEVAAGVVWPSKAHTMMGYRRLQNIQYCVEQILVKNIPGDFIEAGTWRGGGSIFMRALLKANGVTDRKLWVADSFEGLPPVDEEKYPEDKAFDWFNQAKSLAVSLEEVEENFRRYNLLDNQVVFLKGWFKDTLPNAPIDKLAILRLDGDLYESTMDGIINLYPKLSVGGYVIVDDYLDVQACKAAITEYRETHGITEPIEPIDHAGVYWQKTR